MISVIMHCLFPLQSSESCKTMQVSAIYISIRFEDTFFFQWSFDKYAVEQHLQIRISKVFVQKSTTNA